MPLDCLPRGQSKGTGAFVMNPVSPTTLWSVAQPDDLEFGDVQKAAASAEVVRDPEQFVVGGYIRDLAAMHQGAVVGGFDVVAVGKVCCGEDGGSFRLGYPGRVCGAHT